jgi:hypothetical protein
VEDAKANQKLKSLGLVFELVEMFQEVLEILEGQGFQKFKSMWRSDSVFAE